MPGPFPGMDPYLEHPSLWRNLHHLLITTISTTLNAVPPPQYVASIHERLYVVKPGRNIYSDVVMVEHPSHAPATDQCAGGTAVMVASDPPWVLTVFPEEVREGFIEILTVGDESRVITVLEVLSPTNKTSGSEGRDLYLTKQRELLDSRSHLIEIDLLRSGEHTVAPPLARLRERGQWDYLVSLHRAGQAGRFEVWAVSVRQRLPRISVPLAEGDPDLVLDLQPVFDLCYDAGALSRRLDYRREPSAPLTGSDAQ